VTEVKPKPPPPPKEGAPNRSTDRNQKSQKAAEESENRMIAAETRGKEQM
jgi:hypothetical protein